MDELTKSLIEFFIDVIVVFSVFLLLNPISERLSFWGYGVLSMIIVFPIVVGIHYLMKPINQHC